MVSGLPNFVAGFPNTATAATVIAVVGDSGGADPMLPILLPSGGTPASMSIDRGALRVAAEHDLGGRALRRHGRDVVGRVGGAVGGGEEVVVGGVVHRVDADGAAAELGGQRVDQGLADAADADGFAGAAGENDLDVRARNGTRDGVATRRLAAADPTTARIAAPRAKLRGKVTPAIFPHQVKRDLTVCLVAPRQLLDGSAIGPGRGRHLLAAVALSGQSQPDEDDGAADRLGRVIAWPSSSHAASTANITSDRPTSEANLGRRRAMPMMPSV